jgi:hypothetical protein
MLVSAERSDGASGLWEVDLRSGDWSALAPVQAAALAGSADGRALVIQEERRRSTIWALGREAVQVTSSSRADWLPSLSPDGRTLAFLSDRSGAPSLWLRDRRSGTERRVPMQNLTPIDRNWAPDSRSLVLAVRGGEGAGLVLLRLDPLAIERLTNGAGQRHPAFSPDGRRLYAARPNGRSFDLVEHLLVARSERRLVANAFRTAPTADGRALLFMRPFQAGLWRLDLGDGTVTKLSDYPGPGDASNWTLTARGAWVPDRSTRRLLLLDPATGAQRAARPLPALASTSGLTAAGDDLVFTLPGPAESDLALLTRPRR